jgi:hypothetical protein
VSFRDRLTDFSRGDVGDAIRPFSTVGEQALTCGFARRDGRIRTDDPLTPRQRSWVCRPGLATM